MCYYQFEGFISQNLKGAKLPGINLQATLLSGGPVLLFFECVLQASVSEFIYLFIYFLSRMPV